MSAILPPKETSHPYGELYQRDQVEKYRNRANNHWRYRIELADRLVREYAMPRIKSELEDVVVVDVGCSIGTFAIEFAKRGFRAHGIDFDPIAIDIARELSERERVNPTFICGDVANWTSSFPSIDIAICFDIFEHLHDDELGALLSAIKKQLSNRGCIVFHTYPTEADHLFYLKPYLVAPLIPFAWLPVRAFVRLTKAYSSLIDTALIILTGKTWRERQVTDTHCNPLSRERLEAIFKRLGFSLVYLETANLFPMQARLQRWFAKHPIAHRNLFGVACPK